MAQTEFDLVLVIWEDAHEEHEWVLLNEFESRIEEPTICHRVGWMINDKKDDCIIVASERDEHDGFCDIMRIPRGMVRQIVKLEKGILAPYE